MQKNGRANKRKQEFVHQLLYPQTVEKVNELRTKTGISKAKLYDKAINRFFNSEIKRIQTKPKEVA